MSWRPASVVRRLAGHSCSGYAGQRAFGVRVAEVARRGRFGRCVWNARLRTSNLGDRGDDLPGHPQASGAVVPHHVVGDESEERGQRVGSAESAWIGKLQDGLDMVAQVAASHGPPRTRSAHRQSRVGRDLRGWIGRGGSRAVIAAQEDGAGIGRIRMRRISHASAQSLEPFIMESIEPGSVIHTDGWAGYGGVPAKGFDHQVTVLKGKKESASELMPRVHRVAALLQRWLLGTHQGAVSREHLDYYLDEYTFRFNRRRSKSRGKLFYRLVHQAVAVEPVPYKAMVKCYAVGGEENHNL